MNVDSVRSSDGYSERHDVQIFARDALLVGEYQFVFKEQDAVFQPCDYHDAESDVEWVVSVFDPGMVSHSFSFVRENFSIVTIVFWGSTPQFLQMTHSASKLKKGRLVFIVSGGQLVIVPSNFRVYSDALGENHNVAVFRETAGFGRLYRVRDALKSRREGLISFTWINLNDLGTKEKNSRLKSTKSLEIDFEQR